MYMCIQCVVCIKIIDLVLDVNSNFKFLMGATLFAQHLPMVIFIKAGGFDHMVALSATEAFRVVVLVTKAGTPSNNPFVAHYTTLGKFVTMALLTVRLIVVCDKRDAS